MARDFEVGDKVTIQAFAGIGCQYSGKIVKITSKRIHVEVQFTIPRIMKFNSFNNIGIGKDYLYEIIDLPYSEHEKFIETK